MVYPFEQVLSARDTPRRTNVASGSRIAMIGRLREPIQTPPNGTATAKAASGELVHGSDGGIADSTQS